MENIKTVFIIGLLILIIASCLSQNEKTLVGEYAIKSYILADGERPIEYKNIKLILKKNKNFIIQKKQHIEIRGEWAVNDYGDFTLLEVFRNNELYGQARFVGDNIMFENCKSELLGNKFIQVTFVKL